MSEFDDQDKGQGPPVYDLEPVPRFSSPEAEVFVARAARFDEIYEVARDAWQKLDRSRPKDAPPLYVYAVYDEDAGDSTASPEGGA